MRVAPLPLRPRGRPFLPHPLLPCAGDPLDAAPPLNLSAFGARAAVERSATRDGHTSSDPRQKRCPHQQAPPPQPELRDQSSGEPRPRPVLIGAATRGTAKGPPPQRAGSPTRALNPPYPTCRRLWTPNCHPDPRPPARPAPRRARARRRPCRRLLARVAGVPFTFQPLTPSPARGEGAPPQRPRAPLRALNPFRTLPCVQRCLLATVSCCLRSRQKQHARRRQRGLSTSRCAQREPVQGLESSERRLELPGDAWPLLLR
jgi:hypothetical protein